ncbi:hypothetical protein HO133_001668 [Letharia lupina]|uniref:BZIP domain-containing protein n=1 Tax=Letharia lupina TaxID=560253 RepID=A0A8H6CDP4_9LECA|nr:uncharacterized protein HO133_001668 [Letharia lupina]KAF6221700.1 hypothetical protein HO133_001668 [Letharia lupina]
MAEVLSPAMAFGTNDFYNPQATISLSDTSLQNNLMTPEPMSPESSYNVKEESVEGDESKKPTKKRKSWGQELPTPKTNLPPRKRAKTEDEKEQRRIERVLRNRQAAQSSRERKRQEVEKLEGEKSFIEQQNESLKERLMTVEHEKFLLTQQVAKLAAQMEAIKRGCSATPRVDSPPLEPDLLTREQFIKQELLDDYPYNLPTPQHSHGAPSTSYSSPSTATYSESSTPATMGLDLDALTATPDMTQHPAAMFTSNIDSAYDSPRDPIIFGQSSLSDVDFGSLFATDASVEDDLHFFKDGFAASSIDDDNANGFTFDSMVDLDACQSTTAFTNKIDDTNTYNNEDLARQSDFYSGGYSLDGSNSSSQIAATSSAQQPFPGAPSKGCDGLGTAT